MSTMVLELSDFIDPNLTWKTTSKIRSSVRRSRRTDLKSLRIDQEQEEGAKCVDSPDCGPAKSAGASFGWRLSDNVEHIPIKKRRFLFQSISTSQSHQKWSGEQYNDESATNLQACPESSLSSENLEIDSLKESDFSIDQITVKTADGVLSGSKDFSGIAILAAAACGDGLEASSDSSGQTFLGSSVNRNHRGLCGFSRADVSIKFVEPAANDFVETADGSKASGAKHDHRLHWDLNTPMDQWDHPLEDMIGHSGATFDIQGNSLVTKELGNTQTKNESISQPNGLTFIETKPGSSHLACEDPNLSTEKCNAGCSSSPRCHLMTENGLPHSKKRCIPQSQGTKAPLQMVDMFANVDYSLRLGSVEGKDSQSLDNPWEAASMAAASLSQPVKCEYIKIDLQSTGLTKATNDTDDAWDPLEANEGAASILQVGKNKHTEIPLVQSSCMEKETSDMSNAPYKCKEKTNKTQDLKEGGNVLPDVCQQSESFSFGIGKEEHTPLHVSPPDGLLIRQASRSLHFEDTEVFTEAEVKQGGTTCFIEDGISGDAKKCNVELFCSSGSAAGTSDIHKHRDGNNCKSGSLDLTKSYCGEANNNKFLDTPVGEYDRICGVTDAGFFRCSMMSKEDGMPSMCLDNKQSVETAHAKAVEGKAEQDLTSQVPACKPMEISTVEAFDKQVNVPAFDDVPASLFCREPRCQIVNAAGLEHGFDCHLEDGGFAEPVEHYMLDDECEDVEAEHVDYDSDNNDCDAFTDAANSSSMGLTASEGEWGKQSFHLDHIDSEECHASSGEIIEANNACHSKSGVEFGINVAFVDNPDVVGSDLDESQRRSVALYDIDECVNVVSETANDAAARDNGLKSMGRHLQSFIEGSVASDSRRANPVQRSRSSYVHYAYHRDNRLLGDNRALERGGSMHINGGDAHLGSRSWNRLRSIVADPPREGNDTRYLRDSDGTCPADRHIHKPMFSTSRLGYTHFIRRRSSVERNDDNCLLPAKAQDKSPGLGSGSRNHRRPFTCGINRGFREGYRRPVVYETNNPSGFMPSRFDRRKRSFSPVCTTRTGLHALRSRKRSRSRSRTRSPDLRLEDRTGRMGMGMQYPPFAIADHRRERRSPGRIINQHQRLSSTMSMGSEERLKSDGCPRPVVASVRCSDTSPSGRCHNYEESDDVYKRKQYIPRRHWRSRSRSMSPIFRSEPRIRTMKPSYEFTGSGHRRSPGRMFRTRQRFNTIHSQERLRSARFADGVVALPRGGNEGDNDGGCRRKLSNTFERIRPVRDCDMACGDIRRINYEAEDIFMAQSYRRDDIYARGAERKTGGCQEEERWYKRR